MIADDAAVVASTVVELTKTSAAETYSAVVIAAVMAETVAMAIATAADVAAAVVLMLQQRAVR